MCHTGYAVREVLKDIPARAENKEEKKEEKEGAMFARACDRLNKMW